VVTGVGRGTGAALCRRFAAGGYKVAMLARSADELRALEGEIPGTRAYPTDLTDSAALRGTLARIRSELGPIGTLLYNAGNASFGDLLRINEKQFEDAWRINALALLVCAQDLAPQMIERGQGSIVITGATASLRGGAAFAAFAPAKAAQRSLAQSMARLLGPKGIHVAYVIVDGVIDMPFTRKTTYHLAHQDRSAWTFEVDLRPFGERW
jgi:NAD(P)-dependent dehydrogenase (short-subunit alcohol dehydrogenase family)